MRRALVGTIAVLMALAVLVPAAAAGELPPGGTFTDDDGTVHEGNIEAIAAVGVTKGCNPPFNDRYCPQDSVTRGQMAAFLVRALGLPVAAADHFTDDETSIFEEDINRLYEAGITKGCNPPGNTRFCPDRAVTRGEMAAFLVRAFGYDDPGPGNWFIDDDGSIFEASIDRLRVAGVTKGCNPPDNDRYCPDDPVKRDQMASFLARALGLPPMVPPPRPGFSLVPFATGLDIPVHLTAPPGDGRVFIVEQQGVIRVVENGSLLATPFLDVRDRVYQGPERGLLSLAFHPDYSSNGRFFVYYSAPLRSGGSGNHTSHVAEFAVSGDPDVADPNSEKTVLLVDQPAANHNGGLVRFGPDGLLYIGLGDGGGADDPGDNAQNIDNLLGSILRIDVDGAAPYTVPLDNPFVGAPGANEIWAYGLRNPWRFTIDDGSLYIADVGQGAREEVDVMPLATPAVNYGWRTYEGSLCTNNDPTCNANGLTFPVTEYSHSEGCSITGGEVYRGSTITQLVGRYVYSDYCTGFIRSFRYLDGKALDPVDWTPQLGARSLATSFGVDGAGELYLLSRSGTVWKFTADG